MKTLRRMRPRHWVFALTAIIVAAGSVRLGFWQLSRLQQRRTANELIRKQIALPQLELSASTVPSDLAAYRQAVAGGTLDSAHQIILLTRSYNGQPGAHLVTPLMLAPSGPAILVDRGWIPYEDSTSGDLSSLDPPGTVRIRGILLASQPEPAWSVLADPPSDGEWRRSWRYLNLDRLQGQLPYAILPVYLGQTEPIKGATSPRPDTPIDLSEGPHLSYAIQWFSFALIAVVGGGIWLRRQLTWRSTPEEREPG